MSNIQLHSVQVHVSVLCIGHHQVVLRLVEQLYNKRGILEGVGVWWDEISSYHPPHPPRTTWWWPIHRAETCSCAQCNYILLI